jgi:hypothetical protein
MAASAAHLERSATARPAEWGALMPSDEGGPWQVWMRKKGAGYWLMRWATRLARLLGADVSNPNGLEEAGAVETEDEARDLCRLIHQKTGGRYAVTYDRVVVGRVFPVESLIAPLDRGWGSYDPFRAFDFSATDAVREQARHELVDAGELARLREQDAILSKIAERLRAAL